MASERDMGDKGREISKKKIKYTDEPMGELEIVKDFLPSPEELVECRKLPARHHHALSLKKPRKSDNERGK
jgi:hypothetical protein